jgi:ubiquinone/menaquinone biosynthesis C-methylase UbiE
LLPEKPSSTDLEAYSEWRRAEVSDEVKLMIQSGVRIAGQTVLDFGCAEGGKLLTWANEGPQVLIGIDTDLRLLRAGVGLSSNSITGQIRVNLVQNDPLGLPLRSDGIDTILCIDTMEHVEHVEEVIREWYRVLFPGGHAFVQYQHFEMPFAYHADRVLLIPWCHLWLTDSELRHLVKFACEDRKSATGDDAGQGGVIPFLNRLTVSSFRRVVEAIGFEIMVWQLRRFRGGTLPMARWLSRMFEQSAGLRPYLSRDLICVLRKPTAPKGMP